MIDLQRQRPDWGDGFIIDEGAGDGLIRLAQRDDKTFKLESTLRYAGPLGLDKLNLGAEAENRLRNLAPEELPDTDLASVPSPMRWWVNTYGTHTPAALFHDRFIGDPEALPAGVSEANIDRYFRFMLRSCGVPFVKRWIMWSATALRTRFESPSLVKKASVIIWVILAAVGTVGFFTAVAGQWWLWAAVLGLVTPLVFSSLWGHQFGAALVAGWLVVPWLVPPILVVVVFSIPYKVIEKVIGAVAGDA